MNANSRQPVPDRERWSREFASPAFEVWLERLSTQGYCQLLVALILKLERMAQAPLDGSRRVAILREAMTLIHDVADDLPRNPGPQKRVEGVAGPLSLAQRLGAATYENLKLTLEALDHGGGAVVGERDRGRLWVVGEMYAWLGHQIEIGADRGLAWPQHTWQELHDLFSYSTNRLGRAGPDSAALWGAVQPGTAAGAGDPETVYKRLLMIGLCAEQEAGALLAPSAAEPFSAWVRAAQLDDPAAYFGVLGTYLVEASSDTPPRLVPGALGPVSRARVLRLPPAFLAALAAAKAGRHPFAAG